MAVIGYPPHTGLVSVSTAVAGEILHANDAVVRTLATVTAVFTRPCLAQVSYRVNGRAGGNGAANVYLYAGATQLYLNRWHSQGTVPVIPLSWTLLTAITAPGSVVFTVQDSVDAGGLAVYWSNIDLLVQEMQFF